MRNLVFLHGALGCKKHWLPVTDALRREYQVHELDFPGHGSAISNDSLLEFNTLVHFVESYCIEKQLEDFSIIGYSLGGYVGMQLAINKLKGLSSLITIATKVLWSEEIAEKEIGNINTSTLQVIIPKLESEHGDNWPNLLDNTHSILKTIGQNPISLKDVESILIPVFMLRGEKDKMVTELETVEMVSRIQNGKYIELQAQGHLLERMDTDILLEQIKLIV